MLKYLFRATFNDGTVYEQSPDDRAKFHDRGSAFTDVMDRIAEVRLFSLHDDNPGPLLMVDLADGHFEVDGIRIYAQDPSVTPPPGTRYSLLYFRRRTLTTSGESVPDEYHIGTFFELDGETHRYTLAIT